jgi:hypothetical protein
MDDEPAESIEQLLRRSEGMPKHLRAELWSELVLGQTAMILRDRGQSTSSALMLDVEGVDIEEIPAGFYSDASETVAFLDVATFLLERFTPERLEEIKSAMHAVQSREGVYLDQVRVRETLPQVGHDWRAQLEAELTSSEVTNQGRRTRLAPTFQYREDGLAFQTAEELAVYRALKAKQEQLPADATMAIFPLPGVYIPGHTWEPDFLVTYRGNAGVIEVDGDVHSKAGRRSADLSRDRLLEDAGVKLIDRIDVRDAENLTELAAFIDRFIRRLGSA